MRSCFVIVLSASLLSSSAAQDPVSGAAFGQLQRGRSPAEGVGARALARADLVSGALLGAGASGVALGDLDGDGDVDAVVTRADQDGTGGRSRDMWAISTAWAMRW